LDDIAVEVGPRLKYEVDGSVRIPESYSYFCTR